MPVLHTNFIKNENGTVSVAYRCTQSQEEEEKHEEVPSIEGSIEPATTSLEDSIDPISCQFCQIICNSAVSMSCHNRTHLGNNDFVCIICNEPFESEIGLTVHDEICHKKKRKKRVRETCECDICGKVLTSYNRLLDHMEGHQGDREFACELCEMRFLTELNLKTHFSYAHDNASNRDTYICDICGKCYKNKKELIEHTRSHLVLPLPCEVCGKCFKSRPVLLAHQKFHVDALPHHCEYCNKTFLYRGHLIAHKRIHNKEGSESCDICGKVFSGWHNLQKHRRIHSDKTPFICEICGRGFKRRGGQLAHMKSHQQGRLYKKSQCLKVSD